MATWQHELVEAPTQPRARELWLQNAAAVIVFEDVRRYAMERIDSSLSSEARAAAQKGIDDAVYGLMMVMDGVTGGLMNASHTVNIDFIARLATRGTSGEGAVVAEVDLRQSDGMCMGYHNWIKGDFGEHAVAVPKSAD